MGRTAKELEIAWTEASLASGFHDKGIMTRLKAQRAGERFYDLFFQKTGLHDSLVRGLFNDWNKLPHEEAIALAVKHGVTNSFCAFMAEYLEKKVALAGISTAYHHSDEENPNGDPH